MSITAAQLLVKVNADTGMAETKLGGMSKLLGVGGPLVLGAAAAAAAVFAVGGVAVHMAGDFQQGMTQLVTGAGESKSNLAMVSQGILQMAKDTGTSTDQLSQGMYLIESAGYHGKAGLDVLKAAAQGAKVGNADLGTVSDATTTIMTDFAGQNVTAAQAVNTLVATVAQGKTHMQDLSGALASALPTAASYKVHLNDVMGALSTMTAAGIPAADAATYLRQTLIGLGSPTSAAAKALASVGLSSAQVNAEMQQSLPDTLKMITDAVGKKFPAGSVQYNEAIKAIAGGSKQMQGMLALTGDHLKTFQTDVGNISAAVKQGGSSIQGWSDVQGDFNFKMDKMGATFQSVMITMGTQLLPVVGKLVDAFSSFLPGAVSTLTDILGPLISGIADLFGSNGLGKGESMVKPVAGAMSSLGASIRTNVVPFVTSLAKIFAQDVMPAISSVAHFAITTLLPAVMQFAGWVGANVIPVVQTLAHVFVTDILPVVEQVAGAIMSKLIPPLENIAGHVLPILNPLFQTLGFIFKNVLGPAANVVINIIGLLLDGISGIANVVGGVISGIRNFVGMIVGFFQGLFDKLIGHSIIPDLIKGIVGFFLSLPLKILGGLASFVGKVIGFFVGLAGKAIGAVAGFIGKIIGFFVGLPGKILGALGHLVSGVVGAFAGMAGKALGFLGGLVGGAISGIGHMVGSVVSGVGHMASSVINGAKNLATGAAKHVASFVSNTVSGAAHAVGGWFSGLASWVGKTTGIAQKVSAAVKVHTENAKKSATASAGSLVTGWLGSLLHLVSGTSQKMQQLTQAAAAHTDKLKIDTLTKTAAIDMQAAAHFNEMRQKITAALASTTDESKRRSLEAQLAIVTAAEKQKELAAMHAAEMAKQVATQLRGMATDAHTQGQQMMLGLKGGLSSMLGNVMGTVGNIAHSILGGIGSLFGIHSPSTVFAEIGRNLSLGLIQGVAGVNVAGGVAAHMASVTGAASALSLGAPGVGGAVSGFPAGMAPAYGVAQGAVNGQPIQVTLNVDGRRLAQIVTQHQPSVIRNATGTRNF